MEQKRKREHGNQPAAETEVAVVGTPAMHLESVPAAEPPTSRRRGQKRKASGGNASTPPATSSSKRQAREKVVAVAHVPIHNGPLTRARQSPGGAAVSVSAGAPSTPVMKNEEEAEGPLNTGDGEEAKAAEEDAAVEEDLEALESKIEAEFGAILSRDRSAHVVPIPAGWFSWTRIHPMEKQTLPSFFDGKSESRTPEIYIEIRNWILRKFHADPNTQIELKDLSELSVGEADARQEVMEFLDHWGLINYHPFPQSDGSTGKVDKATKADSLVDILYRFENESFMPVVAKADVTTTAATSSLSPESAIAEELARQEEPSVEYHCNSCSADCSRKRYHCQKQADYDLCAECFNSRKFDSDMSPVDFILMDTAETAGASGGKWTDQETLLLLEALELFKDNWNEIADHVATKTKAQCILHFVQMPIEETLLACNNETESSKTEGAGLCKTENYTSALKDETDGMGSKTETDANQASSAVVKISVPEDGNEKKEGWEANQNLSQKALIEAFEAAGSPITPGSQFSFAEAGNPVMALAAFLVRLAEPNVVTAMTRLSLKCISDNSPSMQLAARHCFRLENPPDGEKKSAVADSVPAESPEPDAVKSEKQNKENQKQDVSDCLLSCCDLSNDHNSAKEKDGVRKENKACNSPNDTFVEESTSAKKMGSNESVRSDLPNDRGTRDVKESDELVRKTETCPTSVTAPVDNEDGKSDFLEETSANESNGSDPKTEVPVSSAKDSSDWASKEEHTESAKVEVAAPGGLSSEMKEGDGESKDSKSENQDPHLPTSKDDKDECDHDRLKRAAVTALSAAAVKAKFLADQEEDQIRQLTAFLIDKQLHKLETKLAFFSEMEASVMRVREQIERSKQRLFQERAVIIATRFGLPQSSSRPMPQSVPINRVAMGFATSAMRPPMGMFPQRPPGLRPVTTLAPPSTSVANSFGPINQDKATSFVTK